MPGGLFKFGFTKQNEADGGDGENQVTNTEKQVKGRAETKKKYEIVKRKRLFFPKWKDEFKWVEYDEGGELMYCTPCRTFEKGGRFVEGTNNFRIDSLKQHDISTSHISAQRQYTLKVSKQASDKSVLCSYTGDIVRESVKPDELHPAVVGPLDIVVRQLNKSQQDQLLACFNTAYFIAKKELPFSLYPGLLELQSRNGVELPKTYQTDMACRRFIEFIYKDIQHDTIQLLKNARVISIMFDGATDIAVSENEIVYARIVVDGVPKNVYVKIQDVEHAHAEGVLSAIEISMNSVDSEWNWKEKLIATGSDGASVNLGKKHSVTALLKQETPHLIAIHCLCHRLELGALDAMKVKDNKIFADLKQVLLCLHKHYHYSAKALRELKMLADAMDEKMIRPANLEGTRWMPHLSRCLDVLLRQYVVFVAHFENTVNTGKGSAEVQGRAKLILKHMKDYRLLHYMHFLQDVLSVLSELSLKFQRDDCTIPDAVEALETACLQLVAMQHRSGEHLQTFMNSVIQVDQDAEHTYTFHGIKLGRPTVTEDQFKRKQSELIDSVIDHLNKRLGDIDSSTVLKDMQVFFPVNLPETDSDRAVYGEAEVSRLSEYYSSVLDRMGCDVQQLKKSEWPALKVHMKNHNINVSVQVFYSRMYSNPKLKDCFKNILMLVEIIMCVPVSSAMCEIGFSAMARIKSDWRASLNLEMLNFLMAISVQGPVPNDYNAERAVALWWHGGQRARRPDFDQMT